MAHNGECHFRASIMTTIMCQKQLYQQHTEPANLYPLKFYELYHVEPFLRLLLLNANFMSHILNCNRENVFVSLSHSLAFYLVFSIQTRYHSYESQKNTYKLLTKVICSFLRRKSSKQPKKPHGSCNLFNVLLIIFNISDTSRNKNKSLIID